MKKNILPRFHAEKKNFRVCTLKKKFPCFTRDFFLFHTPFELPCCQNNEVKLTELKKFRNIGTSVNLVKFRGRLSYLFAKIMR